MRLLTAKAYKHILSVFRDDTPLFDIPYQVVVNGLAWFADLVEVNGMRIEAHIGETRISDTIEPNGRMFCITRRWSLRGSFDARVLFTAFRTMRPERWCVPGAVYAAGPDIAVRSVSIGPIREEAATIPGCAVLESQDWTFGVFTQPAESPEELCSVATHISGDYAEINLSVPGVLPTSSGKSRGFQTAEWDVDGQVTYERKFYVWSHSIIDGGRETVLSDAREISDFEPDPPPDQSDSLRARTHFLVENFFIERSDAIGFVNSVGSLMLPKRPWLTGSGPGGNIEAARAVFRIGRATDDRYLKRIALDTADFFLSDTDRRNLFSTDYKLPRRKWVDIENSMISVRTIGEFVKSAALLHINAGNDTNPRWIHTCRKITDSLLEKKFQQDALSETHDGPAAAGHETPPPAAFAFAASAMSILYKASRDYRYLEASEWLAGSLIHTLDSGIAPYINEPSLTRDEACELLCLYIHLYNETGRKEYIDAARRAADYLISLTYSYKTVLPPRSRLDNEAFITLGGVLPAPGACVLDPCSISVASVFLDLWKITNDDTLRRRAIQIINFSVQLLNTSIRSSGHLVSLDGYQPDNFFHTSDPKSPGRWGGVSNSFSSVTPILTLNTLLDINEKHPDILPLNFPSVVFEDSYLRSIAHAILSIGCFIKVFS